MATAIEKADMEAARELIIAAEARLVRAHTKLLMAGEDDLAERAFAAAASTSEVRRAVQKTHLHDGGE